MTSYARIIGIALILVLAGAFSAYAAGYERHDSGTFSRSTSKKGIKTVNYQEENSSLFKKCPAALDEVAFFVRDILSQFGLANSKRP